MSDNDTSGHSRFHDYYVQVVYLLSSPVLNIIATVVTLATLIYGVTSWCVIKKFRNYRNFVLFNAILSNFIVKLDKEVDTYFFIDGYDLSEYFVTAKNHWLVVMSHMFYVDIVKVFGGHIHRRYLKSFIFGWGVSLVTTIVFKLWPNQYEFIVFETVHKMFRSRHFANWLFAIVMYGNFLLPILVNSFIYVIIVFSLCLSINRSGNTCASIRRRLYIATLIFVLSDVLLLIQYVHFMFGINYVLEIILIILYEFNPLILQIFIVCLKSNRIIWYEFCVKKINQRRRNDEINMRGRTAQGPGVAVPDVNTVEPGQVDQGIQDV